MNSSQEDLLRADVLLEGATIFVIVNREEKNWPFRIENRSDTDVIVAQHVSLNSEYIFSSLF